MTIGEELLASDVEIPWAIDAFPEWISTAYLQEDVQAGPITSHEPRGLFPRTATPTDGSKVPTGSDARGGIQFAANSGQQFTMPGHRNARWDYRWTIFTFRIDDGTGPDAETLLVDINRGNKPGLSTPAIWYHMDLGLHVQYLGRNQGGVDRRVLVGDNAIADGETWNVLVCGMRYGQIFAELNGVPLTSETPQPERYSTERQEDEISSAIGDPGQGHMAWAMDALVFGLTEPTEAMVDKMTGWAAHRLGVQGNLPEDHPYRTKRPIIDAQDFPNRYVHHEEEWLALGKRASDKSVTRVNAGGERIDPKSLGFERVFLDDFRASRLSDSRSGEGDLWQGPGFNTAVGVDAPLIPPGRKPDAYPYDAENGYQILSLVQRGNDTDRWHGSALYTVNDLGYGYTWQGPKVFRIRVKFPDVSQKELAGGLFPAFWSYDPDYLFWRTANRIEVDYFEFDGQNERWLNGLSTHYHYSHVKDNIFAKNAKSYKRYQVYGGELTEDKSKIPGGLDFWDGRFHTWEFVIDEDLTYINVTIDDDGAERWVEVARAPTSPTYLQNLDLQLDYALKARHGKPTGRQDMIVDFVEVLQKTDRIERVPEPFTARPQLSGSATAGSTITCDPNIEGVSDIRYFWYADDYPLTWGTSRTYTVTEADAGKQIRCRVKAVGALDQPEAWSGPLD